MIIPFQGRELRPDETVKIHRNLNDRTGKEVWSILARRNGKDVVVAHAPFLALENVQFRVQPAGHAKAVATGQRNVHAYASGRIANRPMLVTQNRQVSYNPFRADTFTDESGEPVTWAVRVMFDPYGTVWAQ